jgi:hypothetical protein
MAIRLRKVDGVMVALCAAKTIEELGDIYLSDEEHYALARKFERDWMLVAPGEDSVEGDIMAREERG